MLSVRVTTMDIRTGRKSVKDIDHDDFEDRKWLGKHCFWAMRNGLSVETRPAPVRGADLSPAVEAV